MMGKKHNVIATVRDKKGRIIGRATNNYKKTHPLQAHFAQLAAENDRIYLHAEIAALLKCGTKLPHSIYIERKNQDGPALAAPCRVCRLAIEHFGVKKISYTV